MHARWVCAQWPARGRKHVLERGGRIREGGVFEEIQRRFVAGAVFYDFLGYFALIVEG